MTNIYLLTALLIFIPCLEVSANNISELPEDVSTFIEERNLCDHFRWEEPYDEERRIFLANNIQQFCTSTDKKLSDLKKKYQGQENIINKLSAFEEDIEADHLNP